jgi:hypothetical protein
MNLKPKPQIIFKMKQIIMTLAIAISSLTAFAGEEIVSKPVLNAFNREFSTAQEVKWTSGTDFYKATFVLNDQYISAFYNTEGELMAMSRNISSVNLPLKLQAKIRNEYAGYWISDLFEMSGEEGTNYYITLEKGDSRVVLRSEDNTDWSVYRKTAKL